MLPTLPGSISQGSRSSDAAERDRQHLELHPGAAVRLEPHMTDVGRIERGERDPGVKTVVRLAKGLGVKPGELFEGVE